MASVLAGDDLPASGSFREAWTTPPDVFSRKREDDDEDELRWAAIERLPTLDRMKKGVVSQLVEDGNVVKRKVVDVTRLGLNDRRQLLESVLKIVEEDNERFLGRVRDRTDRVGIDIPKIEVRYENLSVEGDVHVGSRALPTLLNNVLGLIRLVPSKKKKIQILENVSGIVNPSRRNACWISKSSSDG